MVGLFSEKLTKMGASPSARTKDSDQAKKRKEEKSSSSNSFKPASSCFKLSRKLSPLAPTPLFYHLISSSIITKLTDAIGRATISNSNVFQWSCCSCAAACNATAFMLFIHFAVILNIKQAIIILGTNAANTSCVYLIG